MNEAGPKLSFDPPPMSVSMPESVEWHMILDHELNQLSRFEMGVVGSLGLVFLGTALGTFPSFLAVWNKLGLDQPPMTAVDLAYVAVFCGTVVGAAICLILGGINLCRNKGLANTIRKRTRHGVIGPAATDESATPSA